MSSKSAKVITSLIGVMGVILYGYLIFICNIPEDYQKYTVLASAVGLLYPVVSLSDNEFLVGKGYMAFAIGFVGTCAIFIVGYTSKDNTDAGVVWDFLVAITSEAFRYLYFFLLIIANVFSLMSKKISMWLSSFIIGFMMPVLILVLIILVIGVSILGATSKSKGSSNLSWSSIFSNTSDGENNKREDVKISNSNNLPQSSELIYTFNIEYDYSNGSRKGLDPISYNQRISLPRNASLSDISKALKRMHGPNATVLRYTIES